MTGERGTNAQPGKQDCQQTERKTRRQHARQYAQEPLSEAAPRSGPSETWFRPPSGDGAATAATKLDLQVCTPCL